MQFYLDGYFPGDPDILPAAPGAEARPATLPDEIDVLIVGSGPAGTAALPRSFRRSRRFTRASSSGARVRSSSAAPTASRAGRSRPSRRSASARGSSAKRTG